MANFIWTAKDKSGKTIIKEVEAETTKAAEDALLAEGYSELALKGDEIMAAAAAGFPDKMMIFGEEVKLTAEEKIKGQDDPPATYWTALRQGIALSRIECLLIFLCAIYSGCTGHWIYALLLITALLAWLIFIICVSLPSIYYRKLIQAADWERWKEVLSTVNALQTIGRFSFIKVPATELTRNRTKALAGLGRLDEALAEYKQCEGRPDCPSWLYKLFVGSLYTTAGQHDKAIEYNLMSIKEKPTSAAWADLAYRYAKHKRDPVKARDAMAEADKSPVPDYAKALRIRCQGLIAYLEGDYAAARRDLEMAIKLVEKARGRPYRDGHLSLARAYLCWVLAKQGDLAAAKTNFLLAKDYLVATKEHKILAECQILIGG